MSAQAHTLRVDEALGVVYDALGQHHPIADDSARIASLVPSITELLCDLGLSSQIVARTGFCIHPKNMVRQIAKVGGTKDVNVSSLRDLAPSHAVLNMDENTESLYHELSEFIPHVFVTHPLCPKDNMDLYRSFGALFNRHKAAAQLTLAFENKLGALAELNSVCEKQRVLYLIWKDPWMAVNNDTYIAEMLKLISWQIMCGGLTERYPEINLQAFIGKVDRVLLSSEPYSFRQKHVAEVQAIFANRAVVQLVNGEMLSWYGSRAIQGLDYLQALSSHSSNPNG